MLKFVSLVGDEYKLLLYFDEPVIIDVNLENNIDISFVFLIFISSLPVPARKAPSLLNWVWSVSFAIRDPNWIFFFPFVFTDTFLLPVPARMISDGCGQLVLQSVTRTGWPS